jgi:hypothetical protein
MNASTSADDRPCLYEAMISVSLTGIDHEVWDAYGLVDTYFNSKETVDYYDKFEGQRRGRPDPLAVGRILADEPIWLPRDYFFKVLETRMKIVLREWNLIWDEVEDAVKEYVQRVGCISNICVILHFVCSVVDSCCFAR